MLTVKDVLQTKASALWWVTPEMAVYEALQLMADHDIGALPVVEQNKIVGMFSERDYARKGILKGRASKNTAVRDMMTTSLYSVRLEHSLEGVMSLMTNKRIRHVPVVDAKDALVGLISIGDVLKAVIHQQQSMINRLQGAPTVSLFEQ